MSSIYWIFVIVGFVAVELSTSALVSIWFAVGGIGAFFASFFIDGLLAQLTIFAVITGLTLIFTRPIVKKYLVKAVVPTNADRIIGKECVVIEKITHNVPGRVKVDGLTWLAKSECDIEVGEVCVVSELSGSSVIVKATQNT